MKSIKEAEQITGITTQNIRYYEKQKLLTPKRNHGNSYREYSDEDINRLKMIRLFRSLDMPIGDIRRMFDGDVSLEDTIQLQMRRLESEREKLAAALDFCGTIKETQLADLDVDTYLDEMNKREKSGSAFARFAEDYAAVVRSEMVRDFSFMPDDRCDKPDKFTEELLKYGEQNGLHMVILKESLSPRLLINGVEYWAYRTSSRLGIVVHCEMLHPEDYIPEGMSEKKYYRYRFISIITLPILLFILCNFWMVRVSFTEPEYLLAFIIAFILFVANLCFTYYCYGKNFRG